MNKWVIKYRKPSKPKRGPVRPGLPGVYKLMPFAEMEKAAKSAGMPREKFLRKLMNCTCVVINDVKYVVTLDQRIKCAEKLRELYSTGNKDHE